MKLLACILALTLSLACGLIFGRAQGVVAVQEVFANSCDKLKAFTIGNRVYACERIKREKKVD